jgi:hypothetical protein
VKVENSVVVKNKGEVIMWCGGGECSGLRQCVEVGGGCEWWLVVSEMLDV